MPFRHSKKKKTKYSNRNLHTDESPCSKTVQIRSCFIYVHRKSKNQPSTEREGEREKTTISIFFLGHSTYRYALIAEVGLSSRVHVWYVLWYRLKVMSSFSPLLSHVVDSDCPFCQYFDPSRQSNAHLVKI